LAALFVAFAFLPWGAVYGALAWRMEGRLRYGIGLDISKSPARQRSGFVSRIH